MNKSLLNNRPEDSDPQEFEKAWHNSGYVLEALWKTLDGWILENSKVKKDDFDCPNHYAKLAYQSGMNEALKRVIELLPESAKPN
jgi:hypothetical protein